MQDPARYRRVKELFLEACQRKPDQQDAYLDEACGDDASLRADVAALLAAERNRPEFLEDSPTEQLAQAAGEPPATPERIGSFRILRLLGEGGMGQVFEAEQDNPRRRVALKMLRAGFMLPRLQQRFEVEKSILARLQHPGIAQIFEAGTAEVHGRTQPWFAMEFVDGVDLVSFARSGELRTRERLELFVRICDAVHHAHQKGVIHRDLKPANILVGGDGRPKVLDFGIARAIDSDVQLTTIGTDRAQIMGTLPYMSPEQAAAAPEEVDLRSDVYALGVILYELLSDRLPYDVSDVALPEAVRVICEQEPRRISTIQRGLRGDLETIAAKALEKDKQRRYVSADALAADVRRYLRDEPIEARPASRLYKFSKFARRNRLLVGALVTLFFALVAGLWSSLHFGWNEADARRSAQANLDDFNRLAFVVRLETAKSRARDLYPAWPKHSAAMRNWLKTDAKNLRDALPGLRNALHALVERAVPQTEADKTAGRLRAAELERLQKKLAVLRWAQAVRWGDTEHVPFVLDETKIPKTAHELNAMAGKLALPDREVFGREAEGLALAKKAVAIASGELRATFMDNLAWALFVNGLDQQAAEQGNAAVFATVARRTMFRKRFLVLLEAMKGARLECRQLAKKVQDLDAEVSVPGRQFNDGGDQFLYRTLRELVRDIEAFERSEVRGVEDRLAWAERVEQLTIERYEDRWQAARLAILKADDKVASKLYAETPIDLQPQIGLVPIGMNPQSKLWEFYHLRSAWSSSKQKDPAQLTIPTHTTDGKIDMRGRGIVFVLIPGGKFWIGAQPHDPSAQNYDRLAPSLEGPPHEVRLAPFFMAKHEMTQAQWRVLSGGEAPSTFQPGTPFPQKPGFTWTHPVENVSWSTSHEVLRKHGFVLPTESQWEYACRAGTATPWFTGGTVASLQGFANVADRVAGMRGDFHSGVEKTLEDGWVAHAPVGSFKANAFGLHDMHGNVYEWCLDMFTRYHAPHRKGDGLRGALGTADPRITRGGSYANVASETRSSHRLEKSPALSMRWMGVRAARAVITP